MHDTNVMFIEVGGLTDHNGAKVGFSDYLCFFGRNICVLSDFSGTNNNKLRWVGLSNIFKDISENQI